MKNSIYTPICILTLALGFAQISYAQQTSLWGSGYWGGQQGCLMTQQNQSQLGSFQNRAKSQNSDSNELKSNGAKTTKKSEKEAQVKKFESEKELIEKKQERLTQKIEKFFDSEISEFLLQTHFEKMNRCDDYRTYPQHDCLSGENKTICDGKDEVPTKLKDKWTTASGGYCNANSNSNRGSVQTSICTDTSLRSLDGSRFRSASDCSQALTEYRKNKLKLDVLQEKIERTQDQIADLEYSNEEERLTTKETRQNQTEGGCEECALAGRTGNVQKSNRDWWSTAASVASGLGMIWYGKKLDESAQAYNAQLGFPTNDYSASPYVTAGVSTLINGLSAANSNCANGYSAFSYPQSYPNTYSNTYSSYSPNFYTGGNSGSVYGSIYGNYGSTYSGVAQIQQQLQAYNQIPVSQQTPDIQVTIAQLQARIAAMSNASYSYTSNYGINYLNNTSGSTYYPYSTTTGYGNSVLNGR